MNKVKFSSKINLDRQELKTVLAGHFQKDEPVVVKLHFGEPGNPNAFTAADVKPLVDALKDLGFKVILTDTPVTYNSPRDTKKGYERVIEQRGYNKLTECYVEDKYTKQKIDNLEFRVANILVEAKNVLVLSHVKGHECAGFGGAIKNLGMGALEAKTKAMIHSVAKPVLDPELCVGCGLCAKVCPAKAIKIKEGKAVIDLNRCWGCSICQIVCPQRALQPKVKFFDEALAMGATAAIKLMPQNTFYINVIKNVVKTCDCDACDSPILAKDLGILYADNAMAIDQASIDLLNKREGYDVFLKANHKDPKLQIDYAVKHTGLSKKYKLIKLT